MFSKFKTVLGFEKELASIHSYIDHFDPLQFTTDSGSLAEIDTETQRKTAKKLKARLQRRRQMELCYLSVEFLGYDDLDVLITQEEIDELLGKI